MKTIEQLKLTELEQKFLKSLIDNLYAEPGFSDVGIDEIAPEIGISIKQAKGVLGSLVKKQICDVEPIDFPDIIYLHNNYYYLHPEWSKE